MQLGMQWGPGDAGARSPGTVQQAATTGQQGRAPPSLGGSGRLAAADRPGSKNSPKGSQTTRERGAGSGGAGGPHSRSQGGGGQRGQGQRRAAEAAMERDIDQLLEGLSDEVGGGVGS